LHVIHCSDDNK